MIYLFVPIVMMKYIWRNHDLTTSNKSKTQLSGAALTRQKIQKKCILGKDVLLPGYPGLTKTAHLIAEYIPKCKRYIEPFAGLGRVAKHVNADFKVLNDKSDFACNYNKKHFTARITKDDFEECMLAWNFEDSFFLIDPPWRFSIYQNNKGPFCDRKPLEYYTRIFELLPIIKGDWILCVDKDEHETKKICQKTAKEKGYFIKKIDSKHKLFKKKIGVLCISNKPFTRYNQSELEAYI